MISPKFKTLDALIQRVVSHLNQMTQENHKLRLELGRLQEDRERLELELRRLKTLDSKRSRLRSRLERLVHKIDKAIYA